MSWSHVQSGTGIYLERERGGDVSIWYGMLRVSTEGEGGGILDCYAFASVKFNMGLDSVGTVQNSRV